MFSYYIAAVIDISREYGRPAAKSAFNVAYESFELMALNEPDGG